MPRRKVNGKRDAALKREANKRAEREGVTRESALLIEIEREADNRDADYQPPLKFEEDEESSEESDDGLRAHVGGLLSSLRKLSGTLSAADIRPANVIEDKATGEAGSVKKRSRTSLWRDQKGKTRKARAMNMQPSVASFFKALPCKSATTDADVIPLGQGRDGGETEVTTLAVVLPTTAGIQIPTSTALNPTVIVLD
ncbi:hypothetical protein EYR40_001908 [Pleurotus pulmonarius]|nr:hypothetical protein EYR40_001908 [Pleurotus pulmonarius]